MVTLHPEHADKRTLESWVIDRIVMGEDFVVPHTASNRVKKIVMDTGLAVCLKLSNAKETVWMNLGRSDVGMMYRPVRIPS